jgi:ribosomal protein S18 acetylase RimI-like enzyme
MWVMTINLRRGTPADAAALAELAERTFRVTFAPDNRPEDLAAHLALAFGVPQQSRELADPAYITLLLEDEAGLVAFAQMRRKPAPPCVDGEPAIELYRFYIDHPFHGQGLAQRLMAAVRDTARELGVRVVWLGVWEHNPRAIRFYTKCGFRDVGSQIFVVGTDPQTDRVMMTEV